MNMPWNFAKINKMSSLKQFFGDWERVKRNMIYDV